MAMVFSPSAVRSMAARRLRPIRREISTVRPCCLPLAASRCMREPVERGSMPYSAVTQPWPLPRRNGGTLVSTEAVQRSEERRVGKECRARWAAYNREEKGYVDTECVVLDDD